MIILVCGLLAICIYWMFWNARAQRMDKMTASLPMPRALPVIGNGALFMGDTEREYFKYYLCLITVKRPTTFF